MYQKYNIVPQGRHTADQTFLKERCKLNFNILESDSPDREILNTTRYLGYNFNIILVIFQDFITKL